MAMYWTMMMKTTVYLWGSVEITKYDLMAGFKKKDYALLPSSSLQVFREGNYWKCSVALSITYSPAHSRIQNYESQHRFGNH